MRLLLTGLMIGCALAANTQPAANDTVREPIDVRFLFHYYEQDGSHSAVTGGTGSEKLEDRNTRIVINIPVDSTARLKLSGGWNYYTSASSDKISSISSASSEDHRVEAEMMYTSTKVKHVQKGLLMSGSSETDYMSSSLGFLWGRENTELTRGLDLMLRAWFDKWMIVLPDELRDSGWNHFGTDKRRAILLGLSYRHELSARSVISATVDPLVQWGLLSTPFHRVISADSVVIAELLPSHRIRVPIGVRFYHNYRGTLITKLFLRLYADNFGIRSVTASAEPVIRVARSFKFISAYRFYAQQASDYFFPTGVVIGSEPFRTSDYDLSEFRSHRASVGIGIEPLRGLARFGSKLLLSGISASYSRYWRSDGLHAWWVSAEVKWLMW